MQFGQAATSEQPGRDSFLLQLTDALSLLRDPAAIQAEAARCIGEHLCANRAFYAEVVDDLVVILQDFTRGLPSIAGNHSPESFGSSEAASLRRGEAVAIYRAPTGGVASGMLVGLVKSGRWAAVCGVHSAVPRDWSAFEIDLLQQTAERTWSAVDRARSFLSEREALRREMHHRAKNTLQLAASLVGLQVNAVEDPGILALLEDTRSRVRAIATVYEAIHRSKDQTTFDMAAYAQPLLQESIRDYDLARQLQFRIDGYSAALDLDRAVPFGLLLNEVVASIRKHALTAGPPGEMRLRFACDGRTHILTIAGVGIGFPPGLEFQHSLGAKLIGLLAQQLGGEVVSIPGSDFHLEVRFPVTEA